MSSILKQSVLRAFCHKFFLKSNNNKFNIMIVLTINKNVFQAFPSDFSGIYRWLKKKEPKEGKVSLLSQFFFIKVLFYIVLFVHHACKQETATHS